MNINTCKQQIRAGMALRNDFNPVVRYTNRRRVRDVIAHVRSLRIAQVERRLLKTGRLTGLHMAALSA